MARQLIAVGCIVAGAWLLAIAAVYSDWPALAVALASVPLGVAALRGPAD